MTDKNDNADDTKKAEQAGAASAVPEKEVTAKKDSNDKDFDNLTSALRNNYQSTVEEGVPDQFLDLISKLK